MISIGEFSKMTYLSVKALRHYHDVGLLEPAAVDPSSGYRHYAPDQIATAHAIRRFRDLGMPIDDVREVLGAPDERARNQAILVHLERMQRQLDQTQAAVASLQGLLSGAHPTGGEADVRRLPATGAVASRATLAFDDCGPWLDHALGTLETAATAGDLTVTGPPGALYAEAIFQDGIGEVTAFLPVASGGDLELAATTVAVLVHEGPLDDLDQAYGALGTIVTERGIGGPGPIREHYLTPTRTEVCWPVTRG